MASLVSSYPVSAISIFFPGLSVFMFVDELVSSANKNICRASYLNIRTGAYNITVSSRFYFIIVIKIKPVLS
jgi:hypothetical protein